MAPETITFPARFEGPPGVANGGWLAGHLARAAGDEASGVVTLRMPTPVETALQLQAGPSGAQLLAGQTLLADYEPGGPDLAPPPPVTVEVARAVGPSYAGLSRHPFPGCLVCGTARDEADALCLRAGRIDADTVAAAWCPQPWTDRGDGRASAQAVWAALDCPAAWAIDDEGRAVVLGRMAVRMTATPVVGEPHVVVGHVAHRRGRRISRCTSALYDASGALLASASSMWFAVDMATFAV